MNNKTDKEKEYSLRLREGWDYQIQNGMVKLFAYGTEHTSFSPTGDCDRDSKIAANITWDIK